MLNKNGSRIMMTASIKKDTKNKLQQLAEETNRPIGRMLDEIVETLWYELGKETHKNQTEPPGLVSLASLASLASFAEPDEKNNKYLK